MLDTDWDEMKRSLLRTLEAKCIYEQIARESFLRGCLAFRRSMAWHSGHEEF